MIRVAFLKRDAGGKVVQDGKQLEEAFPVSSLSRIGEHVLIPELWQEELATLLGNFPPKRLEVVGIDHHWGMQQCEATVYLSTISTQQTE